MAIQVLYKINIACHCVKEIMFFKFVCHHNLHVFES